MITIISDKSRTSNGINVDLYVSHSLFTIQNAYVFVWCCWYVACKISGRRFAELFFRYNCIEKAMPLRAFFHIDIDLYFLLLHSLNLYHWVNFIHQLSVSFDHFSIKLNFVWSNQKFIGKTNASLAWFHRCNDLN